MDQYSDPKQVNISLWRLHSLRFFCPRRYGACGTTRCITRTQIANPMTLTTSAHCHRSSSSDQSGSSATLTPGSGNLRGVFYLPIWFIAHAQIVLWIQSYRCIGFESLDRRRAAAESISMALLWIWLGLHLGPYLSLLIIGLPIMIANTIIMSYISTNHLLRPLVDSPDTLESTMSVTTHRWLDLVHFNFSHHVEHHLFPSMSSRYAPLVREKLREYTNGRYLAPPHWTAFRMVFLTPRVHDIDGALIDPRTNLRVPFDEITKALRCRDN